MKKTLIKYIAVACLLAALLTVLILMGVSFAAKRQVDAREDIPDYVRYLEQGYNFDAYSNKQNILFCITDGNDLLRAHLFCIDEDKHTLDILDIPVSAYVTCDGFSGTIGDAYATSVFTNIISRMLILNIDAYAYISLDGFASACKMIDLGADTILISDTQSYLSGDDKSVKKYYTLLSDFFKRLGELGAVESATKLSGILLNELTTSCSASEMISLATVASKVRLSNSNIHLVPGADHMIDGREVYAPDPEELASLLNDNFRVSSVSVSASELGLIKLTDKKPLFSGLPTKLTYY